MKKLLIIAATIVVLGAGTVGAFYIANQRVTNGEQDTNASSHNADTPHGNSSSSTFTFKKDPYTIDTFAAGYELLTKDITDAMQASSSDAGATCQSLRISEQGDEFYDPEYAKVTWSSSMVYSKHAKESKGCESVYNKGNGDYITLLIDHNKETKSFDTAANDAAFYVRPVADVACGKSKGSGNPACLVVDGDYELTAVSNGGSESFDVLADFLSALRK